MNSAIVRPGRVCAAQPSASGVDWQRLISWSTAGPLLALAMFLAVRRLAGAVWEPLANTQLLWIGVGLAAWSVGSRASSAGSGMPSRWTTLLAVAPSLVAILVGLSLAISGTSVWGVLGLWIPLLAAELNFWLRDGRETRARLTGLVFDSVQPARPNESARRAAVPHVSQQPPDTELDELRIGNAGPAEEDGEHIPSEVLQQLTRSRTASGVESIAGLVRGEFVPGQRVASIYVALCPPLGGPPEVQVEQHDGPAVEIQCVQNYAHGLRFDLRRSADFDQATAVVLELFARWAGAKENGHLQSSSSHGA